MDTFKRNFWLHRILLAGLIILSGTPLVRAKHYGSRELDSLIQRSSVLKNDDLKQYQLSVQISFLCIDLSPVTGVSYAEKAIENSGKNEDQKARAFLLKGMNLLRLSKSIQAKPWIENAETYLKKSAHHSLLNWVQGYQASLTGNHQAAKQLYLNGIKTAESHADFFTLGYLYLELGQVQLSQKDSSGALKSFKSALETFSGIKYDHGMMLAGIRLGKAYETSKSFYKAIRNYEQVLEWAIHKGHYTFEASALLNLGKTYNEKFLYDVALVHLKKSAAHSERYELREILSSAYGAMSTAYIAQAKFNDAIACDRMVISLEREHDSRKTADSYFDLAKSYSSLSRYNEALNVLDSAHHLYLSLDNGKGLTACLTQKALIQMRKADFSAAYVIAQSIQAMMLKYGEIETGADRNYTLLSLIYQYAGKMDSAEAFVLKAIAISEEIKEEESLRMAYSAMQSLQYRKGDRVKEEFYLLKFYTAAKAQQNVNALSLAFVNLANFYSNQGKYKESLNYYDSALILAERTGDLRSLSSTYRNKAMVYRNLGDYQRAIELVLQSVAINEKSDGKNLFEDYDFLGSIYSAMMDCENAIRYYDRAISGHKTTGNVRAMAVSHMLKGKCLGSLNKYSEAFGELGKARKMFEEQKNNQVYSVLEEMVVIHLKLKDTIAAQKLIDEIKILTGLNHNIPVSSRFLGLQAELAGLKGHYEQGLQFAEQASKRSKQEGQVNSMLTITKLKCHLYEKAGKYDSAYYTYLDYIQLRDSIHNIDTRNAITRKELQFEYDKKESVFLLNEKLANERIRSSEQELELSKKQILLTQTQLALKNKDLDLQKLAYLRTQAELNNQKISAEKQKVENQIKEARIALFAKQNELQKNLLSAQKTERNALMAGMVLTGLLLFFVSLNYYNQRKANFTIQSKNKTLSETLDHLEKTQSQLIESEKQKNLEIEKSRIARDMHDEIGSGLTKISLLSEVLKSGSEVKKDQVEAISKTAGELVDNMSQIIWAMNPATNKLENLFGYLRKYSLDFFENTPITCRVNVPETAAEIPLNQFVKRNLFLVIKEVLNNIVKHAEATVVEIAAAYDEKGLSIFIRDNGKGFDVERAKAMGNGLNNLKKRMEEIGGQIDIVSNIGKGTEMDIRCFFKSEGDRHEQDKI